MTAAPNNGSGGVFMEITDLSGLGLLVHEFDVPFGGTLDARSVEVWTRAGTYAGFTGSSAGWNLHETTNTVAGGSTTWVPINMLSDINIGANQTMSVYLHSVLPALSGTGIRYTGTGAGGHQTTFANADLSLFSDVSRTGFVSFGGTEFTPRTFSGEVHYRVVPEPASVAALIVGLGFIALRRRK
jgi:hypothetical protein